MSASCCGFDRRNIALIILSLLLVIAVSGWVREATKPNGSPEMVEVVVAAKDLTMGTAFTKANIDQLTQTSRVPKSIMPAEPKMLLDKNELIGKRLHRTTRQGDYLYAPDLSVKTQFVIDADKDILTIPVPWRGDVEAGARVDIMASLVEKDIHEVFTLLPDMDVVDANTPRGNTSNQGHSEVTMVSFALNQKQARLILLARNRGCQLELLLRHPDSPKRIYDIDKTFGLFAGFCRGER